MFDSFEVETGLDLAVFGSLNSNDKDPSRLVDGPIIVAEVGNDNEGALVVLELIFEDFRVEQFSI